MQRVRVRRIKRPIPLTVLMLSLSLGVLSGPVWAGSAAANLGVSATVVANCTIATAAIAFGNYHPVVANTSTPLDATGTVTIACTQGTTTAVGLDTGANAAGAAGTTRAMKSGTHYLAYELYQNTGRTTLWGTSGTGLLTLTAASDTAPRTFAVYGRIPAAQDKPLGSYSDTVIATVNF